MGTPVSISVGSSVSDIGRAVNPCTNSFCKDVALSESDSVVLNSSKPLKDTFGGFHMLCCWIPHVLGEETNTSSNFQMGTQGDPVESPGQFLVGFKKCELLFRLVVIGFYPINPKSGSIYVIDGVRVFHSELVEHRLNLGSLRHVNSQPTIWESISDIEAP